MANNQSTKTEAPKRNSRKRARGMSQKAGKFTAATTGRVVKPLPVPPRLGEERIRDAVKAVIEKRNGLKG
ncbi:MAG: hypothetical protein M3347_13310 [Armatimonadota bacterium]|nr:hypothetical protein [Armatimonadota bacterium]